VSNPDTVFGDGFEHGANDALQLLSYKQRGYSDQMRTGGSEMPCKDVLPLDASGRADWLNGYACGVQGIVRTWKTLADTGEEY
jgi:hypothetical protein